jgi:hypothetical protein
MNLFLAPGEGDSIPFEERGGGSKDREVGVADAMRMIRG